MESDSLPGRKAAYRALWALGALVAVASIDSTWPFAGDTVGNFLSQWSDNIVLGGAALLICIRGIQQREERVAWLLLGSSLLVWTVGNIYYSAVLWNLDVVPIPSFSDVCWLAMFPGAYASLLLLLRSRSGKHQAGLWLDGLIGALAVASLAAAIVFEAVLQTTGGSPLSVATNLAYPLGDLLLMALVIVAIGVSGWRLNSSWAFLAGGVLVFAIIDSVYLFGTAEGWWVPGNVLEAGWPTAFLLLGAAAWCPSTNARSGARESLALMILPSMFGLVAVGVLVFDHYEQVNELALVLAGGCLVAVILRMLITFRDNLKMLRISRVEAMTDALTGLGNRRQLAADVAHIFPSEGGGREHLLLLFDLDGFKSYNDQFGHPAGDSLLTRLGGQLATVMSGRGTAYRMGGDEFCVVAPLGDLGPDALIDGAAAALTEEGEGFAIGASYGSVILPEEGDDLSKALRLADERLYLHKYSRRASAGRQTKDVLMQLLDERSPDLAIHLSGVASLAEAVAKALYLDEGEVEVIRHAAALHDLGKVAIPDRILNKPSALDPDEWEFMKRHTVIGERILGAAPALAGVAILVRSSHEDYDGNGYPDRLVGEDIPLGSRIIRVCDAFDAMTSERAYRRAVKPDEALAELRRCAARQFDPVVVQAFARLFDRPQGGSDPWHHMISRDGTTRDPIL